MKFVEGVRTITIVLKNMILGGNLISLSLLKTPRNMVNYISESLFLFKTLNNRDSIPDRNVFQILPTNGAENIKLGGLKGVTWFFPPSSYIADIVSLCLICQTIRPKVVFEIGTLTGYTALHFALNTPDNTKVYTLDLPKNNSINSQLKTTIVDEANIETHRKQEQYSFENTAVADKITCLLGDSASFDFSSFYNKVDFFFIDGAHSYEYVRSDTLNALKCCHPGSVIAWHDFRRVGVNGVSKWLYELAKEHRIYSVPGGSLAFMVV
jgi:predicted O-methyltransferase YrrM